MFKRKLGESESRGLPDSMSQGVPMGQGVAMESLFEFFIIFHQITTLQTANPAL